mgnify:CR=1 FL=1
METEETGGTFEERGAKIGQLEESVSEKLQEASTKEAPPPKPSPAETETQPTPKAELKAEAPPETVPKEASPPKNVLEFIELVAKKVSQRKAARTVSCWLGDSVREDE